ncbi:MAG: gluconate 2-dehydrogenase subunit 3 family protein, partial [Ginsengibacter sp.]
GRYDKSFISSTSQQQLEMVKEIAYPLEAKPEMHQGVVFFDRVRDLTATGFYTSKIGIKDIGYVGNAPGKWEGVPQDVLAQYNLTDV